MPGTPVDGRHAPRHEAFVVVDTEASGPSPGHYALLSIGACTLAEPRDTFYLELKPDREAFTAEAMAVNRLSLARLAAEGVPPPDALTAFAAWAARVVPEPARPILAAYNAPFDWMFVNDYFHRYLGRNPFGHAAFDIKAYYMGLYGVSWGDTSYGRMSDRFLGGRALTHHALSDAIDEADILWAMLTEQGQIHERGEAR